ncbi:M48 family metallopeptidase [Nonomuraea phyllanthi]|uniref:M48 family metallopeptidase n=1 Tax=Nonomuraea phyllanthi TaxID=2219224 RepID=UPI00186B4272|nr:M48 family metallopeptidase [Nonomuraea phyllanthi]
MSERRDTGEAAQEAGEEVGGSVTALGSGPRTGGAGSGVSVNGDGQERPGDGRSDEGGGSTSGQEASGQAGSGSGASGPEAFGQEASGPGAGRGGGSRGGEAGERRRWRQAGVAAVLLGLVTVAVAAFSTPWHLIASGPPDPARDFTAAQIARSEAFDAATTLPSYLALAISLVIAGLLVATPVGAKLVAWLRGPWWARVILGVVVITALIQLVKLPLAIWVETLLRDYGLSTQQWGPWAADRLKNIGVEAALLCLTLLVLVALARRFRRWWIPAAAGAFALTIVVSFVYPVVFAPLFNDFTPMRQGPLRTSLLAMAERDGVPVEDVLVADASRRTTALNAYVSGFGATRRIVVYDTLLKAPQPQIELVVAHELGHAKRDDVLYGTFIGALSAALGAILLFLIFGPVSRRVGVTSIGDPRAVGAIMGLMTIGSLIMSPAENLVTRHIEARADLHALDLTQDPATFIEMQKHLAVTNISDLSPDAVEYVLYASHPSSPERIAMARAWAELNGVPVP